MQTLLPARFGNGSSAERSLTKIADDRLKNAFEKGFGPDSNGIDNREAPTKAAALCEALRGHTQCVRSRDISMTVATRVSRNRQSRRSDKTEGHARNVATKNATESLVTVIQADRTRSNPWKIGRAGKTYLPGR
jgi:hypothetical protein